jgi:hypothetical protein
MRFTRAARLKFALQLGARFAIIRKQKTVCSFEFSVFSLALISEN